MDKLNQKVNFETEALYMQIDKNLSERMRIYLTECKNLNKCIKTKKDLIETAVHNFMLNNPAHELNT